MSGNARPLSCTSQPVVPADVGRRAGTSAATMGRPQSLVLSHSIKAANGGGEAEPDTDLEPDDATARVLRSGLEPLCTRAKSMPKYAGPKRGQIATAARRPGRAQVWAHTDRAGGGERRSCARSIASMSAKGTDARGDTDSAVTQPVIDQAQRSVHVKGAELMRVLADLMSARRRDLCHVKRWSPCMQEPAGSTTVHASDSVSDALLREHWRIREEDAAAQEWSRDVVQTLKQLGKDIAYTDRSARLPSLHHNRLDRARCDRDATQTYNSFELGNILEILHGSLPLFARYFDDSAKHALQCVRARVQEAVQLRCEFAAVKAVLSNHVTVTDAAKLRHDASRSQGPSIRHLRLVGSRNSLDRDLVADESKVESESILWLDEDFGPVNLPDIRVAESRFEARWHLQRPDELKSADESQDLSQILKSDSEQIHPCEGDMLSSVERQKQTTLEHEKQKTSDRLPENAFKSWTEHFSYESDGIVFEQDAEAWPAKFQDFGSNFAQQPYLAANEILMECEMTSGSQRWRLHKEASGGGEEKKDRKGTKICRRKHLENSRIIKFFFMTPLELVASKFLCCCVYVGIFPSMNRLRVSLCVHTQSRN